jgi:AraC-like DNA-binding protein
MIETPNFRILEDQRVPAPGAKLPGPHACLGPQGGFLQRAADGAQPGDMPEGASCWKIEPKASWLSQADCAALFSGFRSLRGTDASLWVRRLHSIRRLASQRPQGPQLSDRLELESAILGFLSALLGRSDKPQGDWVEHLRARIDAEPFHAWTIEKLAGIAGRNPLHVSRTFRERYGEPIGQYFRRRRLEHCDGLVREGRLSLAEIAYQAGFTDQSHFTREYKKTFGHTPGRPEQAA